MLKFYKIASIIMMHILYALIVAGIIIALYNHELVIALACAAGKGCLPAIWRSETLLLFFAGDEHDNTKEDKT